MKMILFIVAIYTGCLIAGGVYIATMAGVIWMFIEVFRWLSV